jgi:hypothetical protein
VGGYCQKLGSHSYKIVVINHEPSIYHEVGHVVAMERGIYDHPPQYAHCFYQWRALSAEDMWIMSNLIFMVYDENGNPYECN